MVIFQNRCQAEAPSTIEASYRELSTFWSPERKIRTCTPLNQKISTMLEMIYWIGEERTGGTWL